jgi:hypothetical protein
MELSGVRSRIGVDNLTSERPYWISGMLSVIDYCQRNGIIHYLISRYKCIDRAFFNRFH